MAFVWVGRKRFKDADCVSVGRSNLKIKSCVHQNITHPISGSVAPLGEGKVGSGAGERDSNKRSRMCSNTAVKAKLNVFLNAQGNS